MIELGRLLRATERRGTKSWMSLSNLEEWFDVPSCSRYLLKVCESEQYAPMAAKKQVSHAVVTKDAST